jgi:hypothetical protein
MTALTEVFVTVKPDTDRFGPEVKKKLAAIDAKKEGSQVAARWGVGFNGAFGGIISKSAGLFAGAFAAVQGVKVFGGFINDARESEKISRITANAIRATGGAAKISADQVGALATSISNKTAIDDEQVQTAANMLLTFKNIRNETGKNNDIFNRATQAAADLSIQFGGIDGASKQLGKALNDPVKGISALSKAGVTFTEQQKKQIKTLVESGNVLGAQKIILAEIEGQVGGAAAASADPVEKLKVVAGNLAEEIGGFLLPTVNKFATFATGTLIPGVRGLFSLFKDGDFTKDLAEAFNVEEDSGFVDFLFRAREVAISVFSEIKGGITAFAAAWKYNDGEVTSSGFPGFMERLGYLARQTFDLFKTEVLPRLKEFASFVAENVIPPVAKFANTILLSKDFLAPFAGIILGVIAAMKAWAVVQGVLNVVMSANPIGLVVLAIAGLVAGIIYAYKNSEKFRSILQGAFQGIQKAAQTFAPLVKAAILVVQTAFSVWWNVFAKPILERFGAALTVAWGLATKFRDITVAGFNAVKEPARAALAFVVKKFLDFVGSLLTGADKAFGWVPGVGDKLRNAATEFNKFKTNVNNALDGINDEPVDIKVGLAYTQALGQATKRQKFATGGGVFGAGTATSDSIPALLSNGEHVLTAKEVRGAGGHKAVEGMRAMWSRGYANGGVVLRSLIPSNRRLSLLANAAASGVDTASTSVAKIIAKQLMANSVNPGLSGVLNFVRSQVGKPYLWGGVGPGGYDCSGLVSAAINVALGRRPYSRLGSTGSMPWSMFTSGPGAFEVGWFKGNPGHTAATVNGTNIESRGGRGVVMGSAARGARDRLFTSRAHVKGFANGGQVGDLPFDLIDPRGKNFQGKRFLRALGIDNFDTGLGKRWESGTLGVNLSGKTERVFAEGDTMTVRLCDEDRRLLEALRDIPVVLDGRRVDEQMTRRALSGGF